MDGDGSQVSVLETAGVKRADLFIAATSSDEDNLVACQIAKHRLETPRTFAILHDPENEILFEKVGVDVVINLANLVASQVELELPRHPILPIFQMRDRGLEVEEVRIPPDAIVVGRQIKELDLPPDVFILVVASKSNGTTLPTPDTVLQAEDDLLVLASPDTKGALERVLTSRSEEEND